MQREKTKVSLYMFTLKVHKVKTAEFANSTDPDEAAHYEPPHLELCCLPSIL